MSKPKPSVKGRRAGKEPAAHAGFPADSPWESYRSTFDQAAVGMAHTAVNGDILEVNQRLCRMLGYTRAELLAKTTRELNHPDERGEQTPLRMELLAGKRPSYSGEKRYRRKDGSYIWVNRTVTLAPRSPGGQPYLIQTIEDITERKRAEQELRQSQVQYGALVDSLDSIVWEADAQTFRFTFVSRQAEKLLGYPVERWLSEPEFWQEHIHPEDREWAVAYCVAATAELRSHDFEYRMIAADSRVVWLRDIVNVVVENGVAVRSRGVMVDITASKQAELDSRRHARARRVLADCNHAQVHATSEARLVEEMCRIAVDSGGYRQAWIGLPTGDPASPVYPAAFAGYENSTPMSASVNWAPDGRYQGLAGEALVSAEVRIVRDILNDPEHAGKRERAAQLGYQSSIALPLMAESAVVGVLVLHASERDAFDADEILLLKDLAGDIAFGISALRSQLARQEAEQRLRESELRVREVFDQAAVGILRADMDGRLVEVNQKFCDMLGYSRSELIGRTVRDITHPEDYGRGAKLRAEARSGGKVAHETGEKRFLRRDGTPIWAKRTISAAYDETGAPKYFTSVIEDITEQKELALRFELTFECAAAGMAIGSLGGQYLRVNGKFARMLGYAPEDLAGKPVRDLIPVEDQPEAEEVRAKLLSGEVDSVTGERRFIRKDGGFIWVARTLSLARGADGAPLYFISVADDITERKALERRYRETFDQAAVGIVHNALDGRYIRVNRRFCELVGYGESELIGRTADLITHPDDLEASRRNRRVLAEGKVQSQTGVKRYIRKDGRVIWVRRTASIARDEAGNPLYAIRMIEDMTESKEAEERYRATFDNAPVGIMHTALEDDRILHANSKLCEMLGYTHDELLRLATDDLIAADMSGVDRGKYRDRMLEGKTDVFSSERKFKRKDGSTFWVNRTVSLARDASGAPLYFIRVVEDITARKELEQRYRQTFDQAAVGIVHTSRDGRYLQVNRKFCEMLGYTESELAGRPAADFTHPDDREKSRETRTALWDGRVDKVVEEKRYIRKDGRALWTNRTVSLARDADGKPLYFIRVIEDITERKEVEERYRATFDNAPVGIMHTEVGGYRILRANRKICEMLGYTQEELLSMTSTDVVHPDFRFSDQASYMKQLQSGELRSFASERKFLRKDGTALWVNRTVSMVLDAAGNPQYYIRVIEDISQRKQAEEAIAQERALLRTVVDAMPERIYAKDRAGRFLVQNATNARAHGVDSPDSLLGKTVFDIFPRETALRVDAEDRAIIESGKPLIDRERMSTDAAGHARWVVSSKIPLRGPGGEVVGIVGVNRDITERKQMEEALRQNVERFEIAARATNDVIWDWNLLANTLWWGEGFRSLFGYRSEQVEPGAESWYNRLHPADRERAKESIWRVINTGGKSWSGEYRFRRADGSYADIYDRGFVIHDGDGRPVRMIGAMMDVTERTLTTRSRTMEHAVTRVLAEASSADEVMPSLIRTMCQAMDWTYGARWVWDGVEGNLVRREYWSDFVPLFDGEEEAPWRKVRFRNAGGLLRRAWERKEPTWIADLEREEGLNRRATALRFGLRSAFAFPILSGTAAVGIMEFFGPNVRQPDEVLVQISGSIGRQIGQFIQRKQAEEAQRQSEEQFRQLAGNIPQVFWMTDVEQKELIYISPAYEEISGQPRAQLRENPHIWLDAVHAEDRERIRQARRQAVAGNYDETFRLVRPDGSIRWIHDRAFPVHDEGGVPYRIAGIAEDVTERKLAEEQLLNLAHYDVLTGLPNRVLFYDRLKQSLAQAKRNQWIVGVMFIDVDRFKNVNDTLGHAVGDKLLQQVSHRLTGAVRADDTVGRLGGDEFAIVLSHLTSAQDANLVAQKIMGSFNEPFKLDGAEIFVTGSIGITLFPDDSIEQDTLIKNADAAMYRAKELGRNGYQFYTPEMNARALELLSMESSLRRALERNELLLHFQPKANVATGEIVGMEALLRWNHPERGMVPPSAFIPVMEETGLIVPAGEWVLKAVCRQITTWQADGVPVAPVAVNLSARQFLAKDLGPAIKRILEAHGVDPSLIELEITESSLMTNTGEAVTTLEYLSGLGLSISIDDFGTGYSSLAYLKRFSLDAVKIDRSFVRDITTDADDANITRAIISMAHSLGLKVIAEGVESEAQSAFLADYGCDQIQGYYLTPPLPADEYAAWLGRRVARRPHRRGDNRPAVLLVDDEEIALVLGRRALGKDGYQVYTAKNAHEAFDVLSRHRVDVVISDHVMPGLSGVEFLARVKAQYPGIVRIMLTGSPDLKMAAEASVRAEVFSFLPKGVSDDRLRSEVDAAMRARAARAAADAAAPGK